jgi:hypothetical protein
VGSVALDFSRAQPLPQGAPVSLDFSKAVPIPNASPSFTANPNGEGTYKMVGPDGTTSSVPFSQVRGAQNQRYQVAGEDANRYAKDAAAVAPSNHPWVANSARAALNTGIGILKSIPGTMAGMTQGALAPIGTADQIRQRNDKVEADLNQIAAPNGTAQKIGKGLGNAAQFLIPGGAEEEAAVNAAPYLGKALPIGKALIAGVGSGAVNRAQGGSFLGGAVAGSVGSGLAQTASAVAPTLAETALNVTGLDRLYGRTVGRALLDDTTGLFPKDVVNSAESTISTLGPQLEAAANSAASSGARGSLTAARAGVANRISSFTENRAVNSAEELKPLQNFLQRDAVTNLPLSPSQTPAGLLNMKRGIDSDFIGNWNPTRNSNSQLDAAKSAYGSLADEFHSTAPGTADLDQRISSLFPVIKRAGAADLNAGLLQRSIGKLGKPTGALVGSLAGAGAGYKADGTPGALLGGLAGLVGPELLSNPTTLMALARGANSAALPIVSKFGSSLLLQPSKLKQVDP